MQYIQVGENDLLKRRVYLHLVDGTDGITAKTGQTGTCKVSVNGNAPTTSINSVVEIDSTNLPGDYYLILDPSEIKTTGVVMVRFKAAATAEFVQIVSILAFDPTQPISLQPGFNMAVPDVDYRKIRDLVVEELGKLPAPIPPQEIDLKPVLAAIAAFRQAFEALEIPEAKEADLRPLMARFDALDGAVKGIDIPKPSDLTPLVSVMNDMHRAMPPGVENVREQIEALFNRIKQFFDGDLEAIKAEMAAVNKKLGKIPMVLMTKQEKEDDAND